MWNYLKARQMVGLKFRRQYPIGPFIVDFVCLSNKVVIELDGPIHKGREEYDRKRDQWLQSQGYHVIRITNEELQGNRDEVIRKLKMYFLKGMGL